MTPLTRLVVSCVLLVLMLGVILLPNITAMVSVRVMAIVLQLMWLGYMIFAPPTTGGL